MFHVDHLWHPDQQAVLMSTAMRTLQPPALGWTLQERASRTAGFLHPYLHTANGQRLEVAKGLRIRLQLLHETNEGMLVYLLPYGNLLLFNNFAQLSTISSAIRLSHKGTPTSQHLIKPCHTLGCFHTYQQTQTENDKQQFVYDSNVDPHKHEYLSIMSGCCQVENIPACWSVCSEWSSQSWSALGTHPETEWPGKGSRYWPHHFSFKSVVQLYPVTIIRTLRLDDLGRGQTVQDHNTSSVL